MVIDIAAAGPQSKRNLWCKYCDGPAEIPSPQRRSVEGLRAGTKVGWGVFGARREGIPATLSALNPAFRGVFFW
jgi:hypothetical protein